MISNKADLRNAWTDLGKSDLGRLGAGAPRQAAEVDDAGLRRASPEAVGGGRDRLEADAALLRLFDKNLAVKRFPATCCVDGHVVRLAKQHGKRGRAFVLE